MISKAVKKSLFSAKVSAALEECFCHFSVFDHGDLFIKLSQFLLISFWYVFTSEE